MTCQSIPGGTPTPGTTVIPIVTQREAEIPVVPLEQPPKKHNVTQTNCNRRGYEISE